MWLFIAGPGDCESGSSYEAAIRADNTLLRLRLSQLEESLRAIRDSEVDALYVADSGKGQIFTLDGADRAYRALIEEMGEGALTLSVDGTVVFANRRFAQMRGLPLSQVIGSRFGSGFALETQHLLESLMGESLGPKRSAELDLLGTNGLRMPTLVSVSDLDVDGLPGALGVVVTDLTLLRRSEASIQARQTLLEVIEAHEATEERLTRTVAILRLHDRALAAISQGVMIADAQGRATYMNPACEEITGYAAADMLGHTARMLQGPGTSAETLRDLNAAVREAPPFHGELLNYRKDGTPYWVGLSVVPVLDAAGVATQFVGVMQDVSKRRQADVELLLAAQVFEGRLEGIAITDSQARVVKVNSAFTELTGYAAAEVLGRHPRMFRAAGEDPAGDAAMWHAVDSVGHWSGEVRRRRKDGSEFALWLSVNRVNDPAGQALHYIASLADITQRKEAEQKILRLAHYDLLTGLANRALLGDRATQALQMAQRSQLPLALVFIDLDHFKGVNDSLGHRVGDLLLIEVAGRFNAVVREQDTLSRVGGDEFVLVLPATDVAGAARVAQKLLDSTVPLLSIEHHALAVTASIGIAMYPNDGTDLDALTKSADAAMYRAKADGRNTFSFFTPEIQAHSARAIVLEAALRRALERGQLHLHYQPQTSLRDGRMVGTEALLRWQHPELGAISPAEFIPIAEKSGLITAIGTWVLQTAAQQLRSWIDAGMAPMVMAVNLSALQFRQHGLPELIRSTLHTAGVEPRFVELELTESVALDDPQAAIAMMDQLRACGVRISIDDFGTGYSSLSYLKRFKVHKLKIDQSFVRNVIEDREDQAIVSTIISLAKSLGMETIAEGVETAEQMAYLRASGCDEMQGYWFSRPLAPEPFWRFVQAHPVGGAAG